MSLPSPITVLSDALKKLHGKLPGKPVVQIPVEALHFCEIDGDWKCYLDYEQVVFLADDLLRKAKE
jgi:hypothetical protein